MADDAMATPDSSGLGATPDALAWGETPGDGGPKRKRARWDETPSEGGVLATPASGAVAATPSATPDLGDTPAGAMGATPMGLTPDFRSMTPDQLQQFRYAKEIDIRNRHMADEELDEIFPPGYEVVAPPPGYQPAKKTHVPNVFATPGAGVGDTPGFVMPETPGAGITADDSGLAELHGGMAAFGDLPEVKAEDKAHFAKILEGGDEDDLTPQEHKERRVMRCLLKIKNGEPAMRRQALKEITNKAREFGAEALFNQILPLMMSSTLEEQERHLLVKVESGWRGKFVENIGPAVCANSWDLWMWDFWFTREIAVGTVLAGRAELGLRCRTSGLRCSLRSCSLRCRTSDTNISKTLAKKRKRIHTPSGFSASRRSPCSECPASINSTAVSGSRRVAPAISVCGNEYFSRNT